MDKKMIDNKHLDLSIYKINNVTKRKIKLYECISTFEEAVIARHKAEKILHKEWSGEINRKDFQKIFAKETLNE